MIGYAICGSFCTIGRSLEQLRLLVDRGYDVQPIVSETVFYTDTRFFKAQDIVESLEKITGRYPIHTIAEAEPLGPARPLDALVICPCTGNTLAKLAMGITDTAVTMAAKAHQRCNRPLLIATASNDALSANLKNIAAMLVRENVYFVPMLQDDPQKKPHSLVAEIERLPEALSAMLEGKQLRPLFK